MAPPPPSSSNLAKVTSARTAPGTGRGTTRRPSLRVVPPRRSRARRNRLFTVAAVVMVVCSLLLVVVGQAVLASGQVRLTEVEQKLSVEQGIHRQAELKVAGLETPSRTIGTALWHLEAGPTEWWSPAASLRFIDHAAADAQRHCGSGRSRPGRCRERTMSVTTRHATERARPLRPGRPSARPIRRPPGRRRDPSAPHRCVPSGPHPTPVDRATEPSRSVRARGPPSCSSVGFA